MERLARVLLKMCPGDPDDLRAVARVDFQGPPAHDGGFVLADLVALGQIRVKVVLSGKHRCPVDFCADGHPELHRQPGRLTVHHRQNAGQGDADVAGLGIGCGAVGSGVPGKDLAAGHQLHVDFQSDHGFPLHQA